MKQFMEQALIEAKNANVINEVPVGCVFIYENKIITSGCNLVNETKNATRHAEFICIDRVIEYCKANNLNYGTVFPAITVVVTVEPCIMCAAALHNLNVQEIIYGCRNDRFGGDTVVNVKELLHSNATITRGIRSDEAMDLLKEFYKGENLSAPVPKIKKK